MPSHIGLIGLSTMGANLARNIADKKFRISVFNRTAERTESFIKEFGTEYLTAETNLEKFVQALEKPKKIIILVKAGSPVDEVINNIKPYLEENDILIDCGNSYFRDTIRRKNELEKQKIHFIGCGVSGGEEGALKGPSIMPGGNKEDYLEIKPIFESIAAKDFDKNPCISWIGEDGAGHFVKMVHNGIEYGIMELLAEAYDLLKSLYNLKAPEIADIFKKYNTGKLKSYLFEISIPVLSKKDDYTENYLIDMILDKAGQKGTGKWTSLEALERDIPLPTISEAVFARIVSSEKERRLKLSKIYHHQISAEKIDLAQAVSSLEDALYAGMLTSYAQGFDLIKKAASDQKWTINISEIARIWQGGCIIRAELLKTLTQAFKDSGSNMHLFEIPSIIAELTKSIPSLRTISAVSIKNGLPIPSLTNSLTYFDSIIKERLPANFIQGLRDFFGAHSYERIDREGNFHTEWQ